MEGRDAFQPDVEFDARYESNGATGGHELHQKRRRR